MQKPRATEAQIPDVFISFTVSKSQYIYKFYRNKSHKIIFWGVFKNQISNIFGLTPRYWSSQLYKYPIQKGKEIFVAVNVYFLTRFKQNHAGRSQVMVVVVALIIKRTHIYIIHKGAIFFFFV